MLLQKISYTLKIAVKRITTFDASFVAAIMLNCSISVWQLCDDKWTSDMHAAKQDRGEIARKYIRMRLREARWVAQRKNMRRLLHYQRYLLQKECKARV